MSRRGRSAVLVALVLAITAASAAPPIATVGLLSDQESASWTITADSMDPPADLTCNGGATTCTAGLMARPALGWTATSDPYASGYRIYRSTTTGSGYAEVGMVSGRTTTTFTDTTSGLVVLTTYYYVVRSVSTGWSSVSSNEVAVTVMVGL